MADSRDSSPEEGEETEPIVSVLPTEKSSSSASLKLQSAAAPSAVPQPHPTPDSEPIAQSSVVDAQQVQQSSTVELRHNKLEKEPAAEGNGTTAEASKDSVSGADDPGQPLSMSSSSTSRTPSSRFEKERQRRAERLALEREEDSEQDRLEALQRSVPRTRTNIASTSEAPLQERPSYRAAIETPRRDRSRSPVAYSSSRRSWKETERERSYRDDPYREDPYGDDSYREDSYRDDAYRGDPYREKPYRDEEYRNERYRDDSWYRGHRSPPRSTSPRYDRDRYSSGYPDRDYRYPRGSAYEDHDDYDRGRYYPAADYDDPRGAGGRHHESFRDDNLQLMYGEEASISGPSNGGRERERDGHWQSRIPSTAHSSSNGARGSHGFPPARSTSIVKPPSHLEAQPGVLPGAVSLRRLHSHHAASRSPSPPAKKLKRKTSPPPIRAKLIGRPSREGSVDGESKHDLPIPNRTPPPPPHATPPPPPPPLTLPTQPRNATATPPISSTRPTAWPKQFSARNGAANGNGRTHTSTWNSTSRRNPLDEEEDMEIDSRGVDPPSLPHMHAAAAPAMMHYTGPPPDVAYAKIPPPNYVAAPPVPNALPLPPPIPRSFTTANSAAAVQTARRARLRARAIALEAVNATGAMSAGIGIGAKDHATLKTGSQLRKERPARVPLAQRKFWGCSSITDYEVTVKLGQGTFGEVKMGKHKKTGIEVALKKVTIHEEKDGLPITAIREVKLLKRLDHPSIIPVLDMAYRPSSELKKLGEVFMVEPYMDHDLNGMLENSSILFQPTQIKLYMKQLLEGTLYMHKNNILHRDMKAANVLINNSGQLQIADFGLARAYHDPGTAWKDKGWKGGAYNYTAMVVTRWYRPPELLAGERKYGPPIDIWGLGCILAEMVNRKPIFKGHSEIDQMQLISELCGSPSDANYAGWSKLTGVKNADPTGRPDPNPEVPGQHDFGSHTRKVIQHFTNPNGLQIPIQCADLIDKMLVLDPRQRITAAEALDHPFFWTKPFPADPASLPKYQPSKEIDRQRREAARAPPHVPAPNYGLGNHLQQHQQQQQHKQHHYPHQQHQPVYGGPPPMIHPSGPPPLVGRGGGPPPLPRGIGPQIMGGSRLGPGQSYPPPAGPSADNSSRYGAPLPSRPNTLPARPSFQPAPLVGPASMTAGGPPAPLGVPQPPTGPLPPAWPRESSMYRPTR